MSKPLLLFGLLLSACGSASSTSSVPAFQDPRIDESSGLIASRKNPGVIWTHNDSGDKARLFAVTRAGALLAECKVDAKSKDWEAITTDNSGHLYVGDIGNNNSDRQDLTVYRLTEPTDLSAGCPELKPDAELKFTYPEQTEFPAAERIFDAEALFWAPTGDPEGQLYLLTKRRTDDLSTVLYRFPALSGEVVLERVGDFVVGGDPDRFGGMVTDASLTADGQRLAVLTYHALFLFERPESGDNYLSRPTARLDLDQDVTVQAEAVTWIEGGLLMSNEDGRLFEVTDLSSGPYPRP